MNYKGMRSPTSYSRIDNPLKNGERVKKLKKQHTETLAKSGLRPPKSPLK